MGKGLSAALSCPDGRTGEGRGLKTRQRPCRAGRSSDGKPCRQSEAFFEPERKIGQQRRLAAEQMRGAFDVEEKTVGAVLSTLQGEAVGV